MGEIFLAKSGEVQGFEKLFVIKKILPHLSKSAEFSARFADEAKITINLKHANIVPVFEVGMIGDDFFLALEYVEGRDLRRILSRCYECNTAIPPDLALFVAREVANGLAYAHRRTDERGESLNLVHCDMSPPNVLVSLEGEVRVIDFGVARSADQVSREDPAVGFGKFGYMAPEQILKGRELDSRTDLYSLGVVLYEMLVGDRMVEFDEAEEYRSIARKVVLGEVLPPSARRPELGTRFDRLVLKAVSKDPGHRFQSAAELRDEIQLHLLEVNPTISADDLAAFLERHFGAELVQEREIFRELKAADHSEYVSALRESRDQTVSYAMTDIWAVSTEGFAAVGPPLGALHADSTSRLVPASQRRRHLRPMLAAIGGIVGLAGIVLVLLVILGPGQGGAPGSEAGLAQGDGRDTGMSLASGEPNSPVQGGAQGAGPDSAAPDSGLDPVVITGLDDAAAPRVSSQMRRPAQMAYPVMRHVAMHPQSMHPPPMDPRPVEISGEDERRRVEAKYLRVRRQYAAFKAKYGERLEPQWIAIARTAVYSGADRYRRLDRQLDDLVARMAGIQRAE